MSTDKNRQHLVNRKFFNIGRQLDMLSNPELENRTLMVSFSGGRTSAYMTYQILTKYKDYYDKVIVLFANTGQENEATLQFVKDCDEHLGFNTVWLEAVVSPYYRKGVTHRIVNFETACRDGSIFEDVIKKYGIPNLQNPMCTDRLKLRPIYDYMKKLGYKEGTFDVAIGIRADEARRISSVSKFHVVYPLIDWEQTDKEEVNGFWESQPFNLNLLEHQGNCKWCWKKSIGKHLRLIKETPEIYDFPREMEARHSMTKTDRPRVFFRNGYSVDDLFRLAENSEQGPLSSAQLDENSGCSESCEFIPMEGK